MNVLCEECGQPLVAHKCPSASEAELRCADLLAELDAQYKRFCAVRHTSVWGGSFEREQGAAMELRPIVNKLFDTLIKLMEVRSVNSIK